MIAASQCGFWVNQVRYSIHIFFFLFFFEPKTPPNFMVSDPRHCRLIFHLNCFGLKQSSIKLPPDTDYFFT